MTATVDNFKALFPEFGDTLADARIEIYLELAKEVHNCSTNAQLYLAAHFASLDLAELVSDDSATSPSGDTLGSGFAEEQTVGDLTVKYGSYASATEADYGRTAYGRRFLSLKNAALKKLCVRIF